MTTLEYQPRTIEPLVEELLRDFPAILLTGPRASGKTTMAARFVQDVVHLDRPAEAAAFRADPDAALAARQEPVLLDEWQEVPEILAAVKRAVDSDSRPRRFLLTGSVRADLEAATWPGTGRLLRVAMFGLTVREAEGRTQQRPFLDRLAAFETPEVTDAPDLRGYLDWALASGFPEPLLRLRPSARPRWLEGYVEQLLTRDASGIDERRDPARLRTYLEAYALNTAGTVSDATLLEAADVNRKTSLAYERLLTNLFVVEPLPAWSSNRLKRLALRPKRFLIDSGIATAALRLDARTVLADGDIMGRVLETFVVAQLRAELAVCETRPRLFHLRTEHGRQEIDVLAELAGGKLIAIEVKAGAAPQAADARHLAWLRDELPDRFLRGVVLHTGPGTYELGDRIIALPMAALWS